MNNNGDKNGTTFNPKLKNTAKLTWQSKPKVEPEPKDLEFQNAEIIYPNVELKHGKLTHFLEESTESKDVEQQPNRLIWGDNLLVMQALLAQGYEGKIDLIYIDPPFNTGENFNFTTDLSLTSGEQVKKEFNMIERLAYTDTWERGIDSYLDMLYPRLKLMHRLLSSTGVIYVHLDPTVCHAVKLMLDEIFGKDNFRNEIVWKRTHAHGNVSGKYGSVHDVILFYSKTSEVKFNQQFRPYDKEYVEDFFINVEPETGRRYREQNLTNYNKDRPNLRYEWHGHTRTWLFTKGKMEELDKQGKLTYSKSTGFPRMKQYLDESLGIPVGDFWEDIKALKHAGKEVTGFPTQKPIELLKRIISTSTEEGNLVADFFVGSGTTALAAEQLKRKWIVSDLSKTALHIARNRLIIENAFVFTIQNVGNYQRHLIYTQGFNIKKANALIFKLYKAKQRDDLIDVGIKEDGKNNLVFVSYPDRHLTAKTVLEKAKEIEDLDNEIYQKLIVLAWDYEIHFDENLKKLSELNEYKTKIQIETKLIPADIYNYLKKIDEGKQDEINKLRDKIHFYDKPYLKLSKPNIVQNFGSEALVRLEIDRYNILDFPIKDEDRKSKLLEICKNNFAVLIDYYAVDWDYDKELFKSQTQVMAGFGKKRQIVNKIVENRLKKGKKYNIAIRLVDIFGNDAETRTEIDLR